ncbi:MAG TPA: hypothetical protein VMX75_14910, partial [Spirochaetia bacterium]|nr:hypothetical protein [Spirochaetia bacterium]
MDIHFVKLHSSGRDYLLLDGFKNIPPGSGDLKTLAPMIIDRHRGVGGYGFLILHRGSHSPIAATMFEGNGEEREPSPDALLCVGRYAFDAGLLGKEHSWIETRERTAAIRVIDSRNISVNIGPPFHWDDLQELREEPGLDIDQSMRIKEKSYVFTPMELHGYHAVIFAFENRFNLATMGRRCSRHKGFPFQPQVEIVRVFSTDELEMRAWYPLYGEVSSSSSGSGAALV